MTLRGHDIVVKTDGADIPLVRGVSVDGHELLVPQDSVVSMGADGRGTMTVTFTVFARSFHTTDGAE